MAVNVDELLCKKFNQRTLDERIKIIKEGKPRPILRKYVTFNGDFMPINEFYDQETWLTGCAVRNAIYCWTCLLFPCEGVEFRNFVADIESVSDENVLEHKKTTTHKTSSVQLQLFLVQNSLNSVNKGAFARVKKNHEVLRQIIDVVCLLVPHAAALIKSNGDCDAFKLENCIQLLTLIKSYGSTTVGMTDFAIKLIESYPSVMTDTVKAIANVLRRTIKKEMGFSEKVCLVLSEHSDIDTKSNISVVLRYVYNGNICERFIEFADFNVYKNKNTVKDYVERIISEFEISQKFLALSCDGAVLPTDQLSSLITAFHSSYPSSFFVPCHFHDLSYVLEQRLSEIPECKLLFKNLRAMKTFFQNNAKMRDTFSSVTKGEIPDVINFKMSNSQFLRVLKLYRRQIAGFFWYIFKDFEKWSTNDVAKAIGFEKILEEYQTIFLLETFYLLFDHVAVLSESLNSYSPETVFDGDLLNDIKTILMEEKTNGFEKLWTLVITEIIEGCKPETLEAAGEKETEHLLDVFTKIIDCTIEEISLRFSCAEKLEFLSIFNCETNRKLVISDYQMKILQELQVPVPDKEQLKSELVVLDKNGSMFGGKSVHELMDVLVRAELQSTFENVYKIIEVILALPCKPATLKTIGSTKLDLINDWALYSTKTDLNFLIFLSIENDYFECLKLQSDFHDKVIQELEKISFAVQSMFSQIGP